MIFARRFIALLALTGFAAYAASNTVDLAALNAVGDVEWRFDEGMAEAGPQEAIGYLVSTDKYSDFRLTVEFWIEDDTNSGIFYAALTPRRLVPTLVTKRTSGTTI